MDFNSNILDKTFLEHEKNNILGIIYIIKNIKTNKVYIGQTLSHYLNAGKYRPFGAEKRFKSHISEAICNTKKKQCQYLNNSIRKYGSDNFIYNIIEYCKPEETNEKEIYYIAKYNSLYPNGYNLTTGGNKTQMLENTKKQLCERTKEQFKLSKYVKYYGKNIIIDDDNLDQYIHLSNYDKYGGIYYRVIINGVKTIFVSKHNTPTELKEEVYDFLRNLSKNLKLVQHVQIAGSS